MSWLSILALALQTAIGFQGASYALAAAGLNLHFGYTGLSNFGHVGFLLVGAYGMAISADQGWSIWVGFGVGIAASVVLGLLLGIPTLRLRGDYLAIVTIASAEILRLVANARPSEPLTGGSRGIGSLTSRLGFFDPSFIPEGTYGVGKSFVFTDRQLWAMLVCWGLVLVVTLLLRGLVRSPWGRVLRAIREDEDAARALGKNVVVFKLQSFVLGGAIGALAGALIVLNAGSVSPTRWIAPFTFALYTVVILGGAGTVWGPIVGAVVYWFVLDLADGVLNNLWFDVSDTSAGAIRLAIMGVGLMALMVFRPQGILGSKKEMLASGR
ncbi:branched-chain amino acid ABC transporter permease [Aquihabitans sp. G128]|uniref:branched-chain amino acid ABC transporter permease n=1 Tax=Aquihabitans sp. G128 TaxID=2849779 RepID=UPI001C222C77|nr:branched-chain amino acid ABC transporter permease [Aquihabitans sp. G128]QXC59715.1 branched-chain amino acid ABC transporter permease [Aquihabitans sp. G128]